MSDNNEIDPSLLPSEPALITPADPTTPAPQTQDESPNTTPGAKGKRKRKPLPPGSAADFKRKEANRLAAERSRSRASEKVKAVNEAYTYLVQENEELLKQLYVLEHGGDKPEEGFELDADLQELLLNKIRNDEGLSTISDFRSQRRDNTKRGDRGGVGGGGIGVLVRLEEERKKKEEQAKKEKEEREERERREVEAQVEAAIAVAQRELERNSGGAPEGSSSNQDKDGRTILAALMSGNHMDGLESIVGNLNGDNEQQQQIEINDDDWPDENDISMIHREAINEDGEAEGRLGELAKLATINPHSKSSKANEEKQKEVDDKDIDPALHENLVRKTENSTEVGVPQVTNKNLEFVYVPSEASAATSSAVAIVLNADIEKGIREEVAFTRVSINKVNSKLQEIRSADTNIASNELPIGTVLLPDEIINQADKAETEKTIAQLEIEIKVVEENIKRMKDEIISAKIMKVEEEGKVAKVVEQLYRYGMSVESEGGRGEGDAGTGQGIAEGEVDKEAEGVGEKSKIMNVLKSFRGYIGNIIWGLEDDVNPDDTLLGTAFSTPAIARRRRGRPPSKTVALRYNQASLIYPSIPMDSQVQLPPVDLTNMEPKKRRVGRAVRGRRSTGLGHSDVVARRVSRELDVEGNGIGDGVHQLLSGDAERALLRSLEMVGNVDAVEQQNDQDLEGTLSGLNTSNITDDGNTGLVERDQSTGVDGINNNDNGVNGTAFDGIKVHPAFESEEFTESVMAKLKKYPPGSCDICGRIETSVWRKLELGDEEYRVCNACGLYHRKFGVVRPPSLWAEGEPVKKRRPGRSSKLNKNENNDEQSTAVATSPQTQTKKRKIDVTGLDQAPALDDANDGHEAQNGMDGQEDDANMDPLLGSLSAVNQQEAIENLNSAVDNHNNHNVNINDVELPPEMQGSDDHHHHHDDHNHRMTDGNQIMDSQNTIHSIQTENRASKRINTGNNSHTGGRGGGIGVHRGLPSQNLRNNSKQQGEQQETSAEGDDVEIVDDSGLEGIEEELRGYENVFAELQESR